MGNLDIIVLGLFELLGQLVFALLRSGDLAGVAAVVDGVLHPGDLALVDALDAVQVLHTDVAGGVGVPAVHVDQRLKAVLLAAVEHPVDRTFLIGLDVILDEVVQEIIADDLTAGAALARKSVCDEVQIFLQRIAAIDSADKLYKTPHNIVFEVFLIGDGDTVVLVGQALRKGQFLREPVSGRLLPPKRHAEKQSRSDGRRQARSRGRAQSSAPPAARDLPAARRAVLPRL